MRHAHRCRRPGQPRWRRLRREHLRHRRGGRRQPAPWEARSDLDVQNATLRVRPARGTGGVRGTLFLAARASDEGRCARLPLRATAPRVGPGHLALGDSHCSSLTSGAQSVTQCRLHRHNGDDCALSLLGHRRRAFGQQLFQRGPPGVRDGMVVRRSIEFDPFPAGGADALTVRRTQGGKGKGEYDGVA